MSHVFLCQVHFDLQEVSLLTEDREVLAEKLGNSDAMINDQFQRFSGVLLLLSTTLSVPDDLLVAISDVGTDGFDEGMDQVRKMCTMLVLPSCPAAVQSSFLRASAASVC